MINSLYVSDKRFYAYKDRIKILRQMLRQQEWDHKNNGPWRSDHPHAHAAKCTAILDLIAELKGKPSSHSVRQSSDRAGFQRAVHLQKNSIRQYVHAQSQMRYYACP